MSETSTAAASDQSGRPVVVFEHRFFGALEDAHFRLSQQTGEPVMMVKLAKNELALSFPGLRKEFDISPDSADGRMLAQVAEALKYVKGLCIGDPLPREMITREASWEPQDKHRRIAHDRLVLQLVSWMTGDEHVFTNPDELAQIAADPQVRKKLNLAFAEAAERLGIGRERKEEVVGYIKTLTDELAYIETLRDAFRHVLSMEEKIQKLRRLYGRERSVLEIADQVARLAQRAIAEFQDLFDQVDAQTSEILAVLKNVQAQIGFIREMRDDLHRRLMAWDEILAMWDGVTVKVGDDKPDLLRHTYHFLAPRFMQVNEWTLMTKAAQSRPHGEAVSLMIRKEKNIVHKKTPAMKWF